MNEGVPSGSKLPESEACAMEEFADNMIFTLESLGLGLFQPEQQNKQSDLDQETIGKSQPNIYPKNYEATEDMQFFISLPKEISAKNEKGMMVVKNGSFILKAGSFIRKDIVDSFGGSSYHELWKQIINSNAVMASSNSHLLVTTRDLEFKSPSAAAAIVKGRTTNGRTEWKRISDNKPFFECEIEEASITSFN
jgi:hypothetical protein